LSGTNAANEPFTGVVDTGDDPPVIEILVAPEAVPVIL
jgi:hypothetical protein